MNYLIIILIAIVFLAPILFFYIRDIKKKEYELMIFYRTSLILIPLGLIFSLIYVHKNLRSLQGTNISQEFHGIIFVTKATYKNKEVWRKVDTINQHTNDNIKQIRYNDAIQIIEKYEKIEKQQ